VGSFAPRDIGPPRNSKTVGVWVGVVDMPVNAGQSVGMPRVGRVAMGTWCGPGAITGRGVGLAAILAALDGPWGLGAGLPPSPGAGWTG